MSGDLPQLASYVASSTAYAPTDFASNLNIVTTDNTNPQQQISYARRMQQQALMHDLSNLQNQQVKEGVKTVANTPKRRIVQVFIADTDENVPLEKSVIYSGQQKLTDATDQELFFEIEIKSLLDEHNKYRVGLRNKRVKEREEMLEPAKIRDLKMVVVTVAEF